MKTIVLSLIGILVLGGASCTHLASSASSTPPTVTETRPGEHLFGAGGQRSTISTQTTTRTTTNTSTPAPDTDVADPDNSSTTESPTTNTSGTGSSNPSPDTSTTDSDTSSSSSSSGAQYALPHPTDPDLVLNPYNPSQEIRIRNLSGGKPDFQSGQRFAVPGQADQVIIVP